MFDKASCKHLPDLAPLDPQKLLHFHPNNCILLCCVALLQHLYYTSCLQAKDRRKSPCVSEIFVLKLGNLTKMILKTRFARSSAFGIPRYTLDKIEIHTYQFKGVIPKI